MRIEHCRGLKFAADAELGDLGLVQLGQVVEPANKAEPSVGRVLPVITSIIVVLPAPLGPMIARISASSTVSDRAFRAGSHRTRR